MPALARPRRFGDPCRFHEFGDSLLLPLVYYFPIWNSFDKEALLLSFRISYRHIDINLILLLQSILALSIFVYLVCEQQKSNHQIHNHSFSPQFQTVVRISEPEKKEVSTDNLKPRNVIPQIANGLEE